jgi:23S rRNA pseudouridine2605 synthase
LTDSGPQRVQKLLAAAGFGSRRVCDDLVAAGRVRIGGRIAVPGDRADPRVDDVSVDGIPVRFEIRTVAYLLNKPRGFVTTATDPQGRPTVLDLVPDTPRVFPVGRLDRDTEGLLVLTNDGNLAQRIAHPSYGLTKTYVAEVTGAVSKAALRKLRAGVELDDGTAAVERVRVLGTRGRFTLLEIRVSMGRNRIVRRMLDSVGHPVRRLVRTAIGPLRDPDLAPGEWRRLRPDELRTLEQSALP